MHGPLTLGVDTHSDLHAACLLDSLGRVLARSSFPATSDGHRSLLLWSSALGSVRLAGVEGTGSYGASLSRYLRSKGVEVLEVERPRRHDRRHLGKSDPTDAELAARSVLSGTFSGPCKSADGSVEMIRILRSTRRSALKARTQAVNQLRALLVTAPDDLRSRLSGLSLRELVSRCSCLRSGPDPSDVLSATKLALRSVSRRYLHLSDEISVLDSRLARLVASASPQLLSLPGLGTDTAASLLIAVGDNPDRLLSESSFAHLCGVAPIPASSGKVQRHRLNRGGNRDANCALYRIALTRMSHCQRTRDYVARRTSEGKSKKEIIRCLKRYIAREVYKILKNSQDSS